MMYFVYALYNSQHKKIYIGQTQDLEGRIRLHNNHTFNGYTSRFDGDWILIYQEAVATRREALDRERQLKSFRGREFIRKHIPA
jgi:putative endonuclease